jgi:hypothetical protein
MKVLWVVILVQKDWAFWSLLRGSKVNLFLMYPCLSLRISSPLEDCVYVILGIPSPCICLRVVSSSPDKSDVAIQSVSVCCLQPRLLGLGRSQSEQAGRIADPEHTFKQNR